MRCPACAARNSDRAEWCTQCFERLGVPAGGPVEVVGAPAADPPGSQPRPDPQLDATIRDVRTVDGEVEWRCGRCGAWSRLERSTCAVCDGPRVGFGEAGRRQPATWATSGVVVAANVLLPGAGHVLSARVGTGVARAVLFLTWLVGGLGTLRAAGPDGPGALPAFPLLLGALLVWVGTVVDVLPSAEARTRELLRPRVLALLTVAVVVVTVVTLLLVTVG